MLSASDIKENAQFKGARSIPFVVGKSNTTQANKAREWDLEAGFYICVDTADFLN